MRNIPVERARARARESLDAQASADEWIRRRQFNSLFE